MICYYELYCGCVSRTVKQIAQLFVIDLACERWIQVRECFISIHSRTKGDYCPPSFSRRTQTGHKFPCCWLLVLKFARFPHNSMSPLLLITANVGSLFDDTSTLRKNWLAKTVQVCELHQTLAPDWLFRLFARRLPCLLYWTCKKPGAKSINCTVLKCRHLLNNYMICSSPNTVRVLHSWTWTLTTSKSTLLLARCSSCTIPHTTT